MFVTKKQVREMTTYSFAHIDRLEKAGLFPKRVRLGQGRVAWVKGEIEEWVVDRISERDAP